LRILTIFFFFPESKTSKNRKRKLNEDDAINEDNKSIQMHFLSKTMKELGPDETTCHPNEVVVRKCMTSKKIKEKK